VTADAVGAGDNAGGAGGQASPAVAAMEAASRHAVPGVVVALDPDRLPNRNGVYQALTLTARGDRITYRITLEPETTDEA
jgi:hypothetical protein